jgi:MazG family protein
VFGDVQVGGVENVLANWETIKKAERKERGEVHKGALDGLPAALPALIQAQEFQARAARLGFDWREVDGVLEKVVEEAQEVREATDEVAVADEVGDLFFAVVNLARWKKVDAESALRAANLKFKRRFAFVEAQAGALGRSMKEMSLEELDVLWVAAKREVG